MMSYILSTVIVVSLPLLTPISGETQFKCQGETVILEFEKVEFHHGPSTVSWYRKKINGTTKLIAYKVDNNEPIFKDTPFAHNVEIDSDLNLVLRNVSSESNGEYFRRIVNGGIFNSSVNLYVMYAPSGKPIVSKEKSRSGKESFNLELPYLGEPEANVTIKPLKMNTTNVTGAIQQYEICLSGRSLQCLKESPCQNFTIRIGQSGIPMQDVEKAPCQNSKIKNESPKTEPQLESAMTVFLIYSTGGKFIISSTYTCVLFLLIRNLKNILNRHFWIRFSAAPFLFIVISITESFINDRFVSKAVIDICLNFISNLSLLYIVGLLVGRATYTKSSAEAGDMEANESLLGTSKAGNTEKTNDGQKKKKQETTLRISETVDAEKAGDIETKESLLGTSKAGNTEKTTDGKKKKKKKTTLRTSETADAEKAGDMEANESLLGTSKAGNTEKTSDGQKKKKEKTTLRISETVDAEKTGDMEAKESLLGTSKAGNTERQNSKGDSKRLAFEMKQIGVDKTGQNDDIKPGSSHSV